MILPGIDELSDEEAKNCLRDIRRARGNMQFFAGLCAASCSTGMEDGSTLELAARPEEIFQCALLTAFFQSPENNDSLVRFINFINTTLNEIEGAIIGRKKNGTS